MEIELETETGCQSSKRRRSCAIDALNSMSRFCTGFSVFEIGFPATGSERFFEQLARTSITCLYNQSLGKASLCLHRRALLATFTEVTEPKSLRVRLCITLLGILVVVFGFCISFWEWWWKGFATVEEKTRQDGQLLV